MALGEILGLALGTAIAKAIVNTWLKDAPSIAGLSTDIIDIIKELLTDAKEQKQAAINVEKLGTIIAERMRPIFDSEGRPLNRQQQNAIAEQLAITLSKAGLSIERIVNGRMNARTMSTYLMQLRPELKKQLSSNELGLYKRLISEAGIAIVSVSSDLSGFERHLGTAILERLDQIVDGISASNAQEMEDLRRYCRALAIRLDQSDLIGQPQGNNAISRLSLRATYVPLRAVVHTPDPSTRLMPATLFWLLEQEQPVQQGEPVLKLLSTGRRFLVCGEAGAGKSSLLQWLGATLASQDEALPPEVEPWRDAVPLFIRLRGEPDYEIRPGLPEPRDFARVSVPDISMPERWAERLLDSTRALVLIDGLDELTGEVRQTTLEHLDKLIKLFPNPRYVISVRTSMLSDEQWFQWKEWLEEETFIALRLLRLNLDEIKLFIQRWYNARLYRKPSKISRTAKYEADKDVQSLLKLLEDRPSLRSVMTTPLLCAMVCSIHREQGRSIPSERTLLYGQCIGMLLRRDESREIAFNGEFPELQESLKQSLLQEIAFWMLVSNRYEVRSSEIEEPLRNGLRWREEQHLAPLIRDYFLHRTGLFSIDGEFISFVHETFKLYLAAKHVVDEGLTGLFEQKQLDERWKDVIILCSGLLNRPGREELLKGFIKQSKDKERMDDIQQRTLIYTILAGFEEIITELALNTEVGLKSELQSRCKLLDCYLIKGPTTFFVVLGFGSESQ